MLEPVERNGKWGYQDESGRLMIDCVWDQASYFSKDRASVRSGDKWGFIDPAGELVIPCQWDAVDFFSINEIAAVQRNGKWGYVGRDGQLVVSPEWDEVNTYVFHRHYVQVKRNGLCGLFDVQGRMVIPCRWKQIGFHLEDYYIAVRDADCGTGLYDPWYRYDLEAEKIVETVYNEEYGHNNDYIMSF